MKKTSNTQTLVFTCITFFFLILYLGSRWYFDMPRNLHRYAVKLSRDIQQKELESTRLLNDTTAILNFAATSDSKQHNQLVENTLQYLTKDDLAMFVYQNGALQFWSTNKLIPSSTQVSRWMNSKQNQALETVFNGLSIVKTRHYSNGVFAVTIIPIYNRYEAKSQYLLPHFVEQPHISSTIQLSQTPTSYAVMDSNQRPVYYLNATSTFRDPTVQWWEFVFLFIGSIFLVVVVNSIAKNLSTFSQVKGAGFLILSTFLFRVAINLLDLKSQFPDITYIHTLFTTKVLDFSLGDLIIDILLLLWAMVFFNVEFQINVKANISRVRGFLLIVMEMVSMLLGMIVVIMVYKELIANSGINFDFSNVTRMSIYSVTAIVAVILLQFAYFLFSHRMMKTVNLSGFPRTYQVPALLVASFIVYPVLDFADLQVNHRMVYSIAWIFILLIALVMKDSDTDKGRRNPIIIIGWMIAFSLFSTGFLENYNSTKEIKGRGEMAKILSDDRDLELESHLLDLYDRLKVEETFRSLAYTPMGFPMDDISAFHCMEEYFGEDKYVYFNYTFILHPLYKVDTTAQGSPLLHKFRDIYKSGVLIDKKFNKSIKNVKTSQDHGGYLLLLDYGMDAPIELYVEMRHKKKQRSKVYSEFFDSNPYKNLIGLDSYDYAIYDSGDQLIFSSGEGFSFLLKYEKYPPVGKYDEVSRTQAQSVVMYHAPSGVKVLVAKKIGGLWNLVSLASYNLLAVVVVAILLSIINLILYIMPGWFIISGRKKLQLSEQIQYSVIALVVITFLIIGYVSFNFFSSSSQDYHKQRLGRKMDAVLEHAQFEIKVNEARGEIDLEEIVVPLSDIHRMDINLYNTEGDLVTTSEKDIFTKRVLTEKINPLAFFKLKNEKRDNVIIEEGLGSLSYKTAFVPLMDSKKNKIGYMSLPYYSDQSELRSDIYDYLGSMLNILALLLIFAVCLAVLVTNSITDKLRKFAEKLKTTKLGQKNEPLSWENDDEIGLLIQRYNQMIDQLDQSSIQLAKAEREGAWREMAKQIAHEIKNPLTPIKLSVQYLQHVYNTQPQNAEATVKRVSDTIIEQIESLSRIASDFSSFARMPQPNNALFDLNDLVHRTWQFHKNQKAHVTITCSMPEKIVMIYADKNYLLQVFNNLILNAIQAIPDETEGKVHIGLVQEDTRAIITVSDNGSGISEEMQEKVFSPNFTTKSSGTGLGLAICHNIIKAFKGDIYFKTQVGIGTTFYIELPIQEENQSV